MKAIKEMIDQVADTDATVLVWGESGVGKELVARAIHDCSPRRERTFVKVNCAALPLELLESELFGYERGAFTGAHKRKPGKFELADGGTIFLDEIGEMPLPLQAKLLHVLPGRRVQPLGGRRTLAADARVLATTNTGSPRPFPPGGSARPVFPARSDPHPCALASGARTSLLCARLRQYADRCKSAARAAARRPGGRSCATNGRGNVRSWRTRSAGT
jgi:hypothetical protein